jgi:hypothetical protein
MSDKKEGKKFSDYYNNPEWKEKFLKRARERVLCACGRQTTRSNRSKHEKRPIHLGWLARQQQNQMTDLITKIKGNDHEDFLKHVALTFASFKKEERDKVMKQLEDDDMMSETETETNV